MRELSIILLTSGYLASVVAVCVGMLIARGILHGKKPAEVTSGFAPSANRTIALIALVWPLFLVAFVIGLCWVPFHMLIFGRNYGEKNVVPKESPLERLKKENAELKRLLATERAVAEARREQLMSR